MRGIDVAPSYAAVGEWNSCDRELVYAGFALAQHLAKGCC
jgi:hypothetical protein